MRNDLPRWMQDDYLDPTQDNSSLPEEILIDVTLLGSSYRVFADLNKLAQIDANASRQNKQENNGD